MYLCFTSINIYTTFIFFYNIIGVQKNIDRVITNINSVIKKFVRVLNIYNNFLKIIIMQTKFVNMK